MGLNLDPQHFQLFDTNTAVGHTALYAQHKSHILKHKSIFMHSQKEGGEVYSDQ